MSPIEPDRPELQEAIWAEVVRWYNGPKADAVPTDSDIWNGYRLVHTLLGLLQPQPSEGPVAWRMPSGFNCYDVTDSPVIARLWQAHGYDIEPLYRGSSAGDAADGLITVRTTEAEWLAFQSRLSAGAADARDQWTDAPPHLRAIDRHLIDLMSRFPDDARDTQDAADLQTNILWLQTLIEGLERGAVTLIWSAPSVKAGA